MTGGININLNYSIDMVRLKAEVPIKVFETLVKSQFDYEPGVKYRAMSSISAYRHNFYIEDYDIFGCKCSFWLGASHNSRKQSKDTDIVIEYNPNKCLESPMLNYLLDNIFKDNKYVEVKSFDLAIDIPCNILDLNIGQSGNMGRRIFDNGADDKTYYFRKGKSNGAIKIYNKKRESELNHELTRYEITLNPNMYICDMSAYTVPEDLFVPVRNIGNFQMSLDINDTDKVLLLACMEHNEYLKMLGRKKREKIEQLLAGNCSVDFDFKFMYGVILNYFKTIYTSL